MFNPVVDGIKAVVQESQGQLFELLRGIKAEQVETNLLLTQLVSQVVNQKPGPKPGPKPSQK